MRLFALFITILLAVPNLHAEDTVPYTDEFFVLFNPREKHQVLPFFDTSAVRRNLVALRTMHDSDVTWNMRLPLDSTNIFLWKHGAPVASGDFNGDGHRDYVSWSGHISYGVGGGQFPSQTSFDSLPFPTWGYFPYPFAYDIYASSKYVYDLNADGFDDLVYFEHSIMTTGRGNPPNYGVVCRGATTAAAMPVKYIMPPSYKYANTSIKVIGFYPHAGEYRLVWREDDRDGASFHIGRLVDSDSCYTLQRLSNMEFGDPFWHRIGEVANAYVYYDRSTDQASFIASFGMTGLNDQKQGTFVFSLDSDTLQEVVSYPYLYGYFFDLSDSTGYESPANWAAMSQYPEDGFEDDFVISFFHGSPRNATRVARSFDYTHNGDLRSLVVAGDVNGDGKNDYILDKGNIPRFLSIGSVASSVSRLIDQEPFQVMPIPVSLQSSLRIRTSIEAASDYRLDLYTITSEHIATLYSEYLMPGKHELAVDISKYGLSAGTYVLRRRSNLAVQDYTIIISE